MPLHLLGKKSWNVYNADNIARVRRDEAAAKAAEEGEEQRMQELDAQRRLAILRGETPPPLPEEESSSAVAKVETHGPKDKTVARHDPRRKRKRHGEDDTDFEMRVARERNEGSSNLLEDSKVKSTSSAPIVDRNGHIDLFGDERARARGGKNEEAEAEKRKKEREYEDQYTMRFSNAAGRDGIQKPWYQDAGSTDAVEVVRKNAWGREDPKRKDRDAARTVASDPLAMMKKGAAKVREIKQERKKFQEERQEELEQLKREQRGRHRHHRGEREDREERSSLLDSNRRRERSRERRHDDQYESKHRRRRERDEKPRRRDSRSPNPKRL